MYGIEMISAISHLILNVAKKICERVSVDASMHEKCEIVNIVSETSILENDQFVSTRTYADIVRDGIKWRRICAETSKFRRKIYATGVDITEKQVLDIT